MPLYDYEARDEAEACAYCRAGFEMAQALDDPKLTACPKCGAPIRRLIGAPALGHSKTDLNYRAKRAGFHTYKKLGKGEYEKMY